MKSIEIKKAVIYARVSSEEQARQDLSLPFQEKKCKEYAKNNDYHIVKIFIEPAKSGTDAMSRPVLMEMLRFSMDNKIDAVIVHKSDRLARNMGDFWGMYNFWKTKGISILSVTENFDDSPAGIFSMGVMSAQAQYYSANLSREVKKGHEAKLDKGIWPAFAPFGYVNYGEKHNRKIKPDENIRKYILSAFQLFSTGTYSINTLHEKLKATHTKTKAGGEVSRSTLAQMLSNSIYSGPFYWRDRYVENYDHEPIVSKELFAKVQYILSSRRKKGTRDHTHNFMLRGFIYCSCGAMLTGDIKTKNFKNGTSRQYGYSGCKNIKKNEQCSHNYIRMEEVEKMIEEVFKTFNFKPFYREYVIEKAKEIISEIRGYEGDVKKTINQKISSVELKMERAEDERLEGTITREDFVRIYERLKNDLFSAQSELANLSSNHTKTVKMLDEILAMVENLYKSYIDAAPDLKRQYLQMFIEKVSIDDKQIVNVLFTPIAQKFIETEQVRIKSEIRRRQDSNLRSGCPETPLPTVRTRPTMRPLLIYRTPFSIATRL